MKGWAFKEDMPKPATDDLVGWKGKTLQAKVRTEIQFLSQDH